MLLLRTSVFKNGQIVANNYEEEEEQEQESEPEDSNEESEVTIIEFLKYRIGNPVY